MPRPAAPIKLPGETACPCGQSGGLGAPLPYERCCGRYLESDTPAPTAVTLMRSRYTAYALRRRAYLLATWDETTRPRQLDLEPDLTWVALEIIGRTEPAGAEGVDAEATVEFRASYRLPVGPAGELREDSRFRFRSGRWFYLTGRVQ